MKSTLYSCPILMKLEFNRQFFFEKYRNIKLYENPSSGSRADGRTDGRTDTTKRIVTFIILRTRLNISGFNKITNFPIALYKLI